MREFPIGIHNWMPTKHGNPHKGKGRNKKTKWYLRSDRRRK
jgi:hypothetical protein